MGMQAVSQPARKTPSPAPAPRLPHLPKSARVQPVRPSLNELLRPELTTDPRAVTAESTTVLTDREAFGIFFGLRSALLLYACVGIACSFAYEVWSLFFR